MIVNIKPGKRLEPNPRNPTGGNLNGVKLRKDGSRGKKRKQSTAHKEDGGELWGIKDFETGEVFTNDKCLTRNLARVYWNEYCARESGIQTVATPTNNKNKPMTADEMYDDIVRRYAKRAKKRAIREAKQAKSRAI